MSLSARHWRWWAALSFATAAACALGNVWVDLPLYRIVPNAFNRFYVSWWWLGLMLCWFASLLTGIGLILFDRRFSLLSRLLWTFVTVLPNVPLVLLADWLVRIEPYEFRARLIAPT